MSDTLPHPHEAIAWITRVYKVDLSDYVTDTRLPLCQVARVAVHVAQLRIAERAFSGALRAARPEPTVRATVNHEIDLAVARGKIRMLDQILDHCMAAFMPKRSQCIGRSADTRGSVTG